MKVKPLVSSAAQTSMFCKTVAIWKVLFLKQIVRDITECLEIHIYYFYHVQTTRKLLVF